MTSQGMKPPFYDLQSTLGIRLGSSLNFGFDAVSIQHHREMSFRFEQSGAQGGRKAERPSAPLGQAVTFGQG